MNKTLSLIASPLNYVIPDTDTYYPFVQINHVNNEEQSTCEFPLILKHPWSLALKINDFIFKEGKLDEKVNELQVKFENIYDQYTNKTKRS
jgi:hypothetical protein